MSEIIVPGGDDGGEPELPELNYKPTEEDEEKFFLMYNLKFQPSEVENLSKDYRQYLIHRFLAQKHMEQEMITQHRMRQALGPDLTQAPNLQLRP